jgi:hypothetical protein
MFPGQLIVQLYGHADAGKVSSAEPDSLFRHAGVLSRRFHIHLFSCSPGNEQMMIQTLSRNSAVQAVQLNHLLSLREKTPDDPFFNLQWALKNNGQNGALPGADIGASSAWAIETGGKKFTGR